MAFTLSPNMQLEIPGIGTELGPAWAADLNNSLNTIDGHNHSAGSGIQITPDGMNISKDLSMVGNNLTLTRSVRFSTQLAPLSGASDKGVIYISGSDLYYNDSSGNQIRITASGAVNATSSGISSGTATAGFSAGVLVVNAASLTPANIQAASILIGNNVANSKYVTLSAPNALAADYALVMPAIPSTLSILTLDTSGNMVASIPVNTTINNQSGTTYTFALADGSNAGNTPITIFTSSSPVTATVPPFSSVPYPTGTVIYLIQTGAGAVTVAAGAGVTIHSNNTLKVGSQYTSVALVNLSADNWVLVGFTS